MSWILLARRKFKKLKFYQECVSPLVLLPTSNFGAFESQFLLEYYSQSAKNFKSYKAPQALFKKKKKKIL